MNKKSDKSFSRRKFIKGGAALGASAFLPLQQNKILFDESESKAGEADNFLDFIDPIIGNIAPLLNTNRPVVHLPNQMTRVFPRRQDYLDDQITGFPLLALNVITPQVVFSVKPAAGELSEKSWNTRMTYDHDLEITRPWYYSTRLIDEDIQVEYTAGKKGGIYRFSFPKAVKKNILLNHCYENGLYTLHETNQITGTEFVLDTIHNQKGKAYMYGRLSGKPRAGKTQGEKNWGKYTVLGVQEQPSFMSGEKVWASYSEDDDSVVEFRYAVSFISEEQARKNFQQEFEKTSFDEVSRLGKAEWQKAIGRIKVEGGTNAQKRTFYTALYRCYVRMVNITEDEKYFSAYDGKVHTDNRPFYTDDYTWGNYIALHPLQILLDPKQEADMLQSYVRMYEQSGWVPEYPKFFGDREGMFAFHSAVIALDAYRKGVRDFDAHKLLEGMVKNQEKATLLPSRNGPKGALEDFYYEKGYYPALQPGQAETDLTALARHSKRSAVAVTLGDSYDSWAVSELAKELGETAVAERLARRAKNYEKLWNEEENLFMPKDEKGNWIKIDPKFGDMNYYNENNGLTYKWNVQHDIEGLVALIGGKDKFEEQLDQFFREGLGSSRIAFLSKFADMTSLTGQFSMGNQPAFFIPYLYNYTNAPWKTQKWTRFVLDTWFKDDVFGVPGDEDGGSMSAVVVFSAIGFFPIKPGAPVYTITSPVFSKVSIALQNGKTFTLLAKNSSKVNKYIQSAKLNGKTLQTMWFSHEELLKGGTLELEMSDKPSIRKI